MASNERIYIKQILRMCHKIETGLVEMRVAKHPHYLCYKCMAILAVDVIEFASHNLTREFESEGIEIKTTNDGIEIK